MSARTKARKRAVDALFAADLREGMPNELLDEAERASEDRSSQQEIFNYAREAVFGVLQHQAEIDEQLQTYAQGWTLNRMPALDRAILRLATWEILFNDEVPDAVAIDEAVELAKEYSTDSSAGFVNGLLGKIVSTRTAL
ncbi:MAG: transcription antitermination factor NusB [Micrococcales bacterium]